MALDDTISEALREELACYRSAHRLTEDIYDLVQRDELDSVQSKMEEWGQFAGRIQEIEEKLHALGGAFHGLSELEWTRIRERSRPIGDEIRRIVREELDLRRKIEEVLAARREDAARELSRIRGGKRLVREYAEDRQEDGKRVRIEI